MDIESEDIPNCSFDYKFNEEENQLTCIGQDMTSLPDFFFEDQFTYNTKRLDLSFNALRSLDGLEKFTNLEELILDNNQIHHTAKIPYLPKVHTLMINKNCIDKLEPFVENIHLNLPGLMYTSLLGNMACPNQLTSVDNDDDDYKRYRLYLIYKLPKLRFIDAAPVADHERLEAEQKGSFLSSVVRPESEQLSHDSVDAGSHYRPLPTHMGKEEKAEPVGTFGTCKYIYYGRHSEGNRFIRNNDL